MYGIVEEVEKRQCIDEPYTYVVEKKSGEPVEGTIGRDRFDVKVQRRKNRSA